MLAPIGLAIRPFRLMSTCPRKCQHNTRGALNIIRRARTLLRQRRAYRSASFSCSCTLATSDCIAAYAREAHAYRPTETRDRDDTDTQTHTQTHRYTSRGRETDGSARPLVFGRGLPCPHEAKSGRRRLSIVHDKPEVPPVLQHSARLAVHFTVARVDIRIPHLALA